GAVSTTTAALVLVRARAVDVRRAWPMALTSAAGGVAGALLLRHLPVDAVAAALPLVLVAVALYFALSPRLADVDSRRRMPLAAFAVTISPAAGFYDGAFGPGAGSFLMLSAVALLGLGVVRAA